MASASPASIQTTEQKKVMDAVSSRTYPSYESWIERLKSQHDLYAEYGKANHVLCKIIYDNCTDEERVVDAGKRIHQRGGFQALQCNYYVIQAALRDAGVAEQATDIMLMFEKVTPEWRA